MRSGLRTRQKDNSVPAKGIRTTTAINHMARAEITAKGMERDRASTVLTDGRSILEIAVQCFSKRNKQQKQIKKEMKNV